MFYFEEQLARNEENEEKTDEYENYIELFVRGLDLEEAEEVKNEFWDDPEAFIKNQKEDSKWN